MCLLGLHGFIVPLFGCYHLGAPLQWRHNGRDCISNHQPRDCLHNRLFRRRSKKTSKLRVTGLCAGNYPRPVNSPHKWPVTRKMFPFDDVIMQSINPEGYGQNHPLPNHNKTQQSAITVTSHESAMASQVKISKLRVSIWTRPHWNVLSVMKSLFVAGIHQSCRRGIL